MSSVNSLSPTHKSPPFINAANPPPQDHDSALGTSAGSGSQLIQDHGRERFHTLKQKTLSSAKHRKAKWGPSQYDHLFPIHLTGKRELVVPYNHSQSYKEMAQEAVRLLNLESEEGIVLSFVIAHLEANVPKSKCITRTGGPWTTPDALRADSDIEFSLPQLPKLVMSAPDIPICDSDQIEYKRDCSLRSYLHRQYS